MKYILYASVAMLALAATLSIGSRLATTAPMPAPPSTEVAVLTGILPSGETIPLPKYSDGSEALETECHWFVSPNDIYPRITGVWKLYCFTEGRVVRCGVTIQEPLIGYGGYANYLIIATRGTLVSVQSTSWGNFKANYR